MENKIRVKYSVTATSTFEYEKVLDIEDDLDLYEGVSQEEIDNEVLRQAQLYLYDDGIEFIRRSYTDYEVDALIETEED